METDPRITASMLYSLVTCEHRPWMDRYADPKLKEEASPFLEMLWRRGRAHEEDAVSVDGASILNLRCVSRELREGATLEAMQRREPLIYGGRISYSELLGEPDLIRHVGDGKYVPGDIKSGAGEEGPGDDDKKPKKHYGVQLALYVDILERLGLSDGRRDAFVWDIHGDEVAYDLTAPKGKRTPESLWDDYLEYLVIAREIISGVRNPGPSYQGECKNCVWYNACLADLEAKDDLTLLPGLGRSKRTPLLKHARTIAEFAAMRPDSFLDENGKSIVPGLGADSIARFHSRAVLSASKGHAYMRAPIAMSEATLELFFDIETDPMSDHCYLHGFVERRDRDNSTERYVGFFSPEPTTESERAAFAAAWDYVKQNLPCVIYIYSKYERTWWRALQAKYPDVCNARDIEAMFADDVTVDLLAVVQSSTEWPTRDHSIKTLAHHLGFSWRDTHPSGAASIEWYDRFAHGDASAKERILLYNEDDCRATRVLLDGIRLLSPGPISIRA
jgi:predicted RecB family nuclease